MPKLISRYFFIFFITSFFCIFLFYSSTFIPRSAIAPNIEKSISYIRENEAVFYSQVPGEAYSKIDNFENLMLLDIMYCFDETSRFSSLLEAPYYLSETKPFYDCISDVMSGNVVPNQIYPRYWHGMLLLLRPLFMFTDLVGVRHILAIFQLLLLLVFSLLMLRKKYYSFLCFFLLGLLITHFYVILNCVSFTVPFWIMLTMCLFSFISFKKDSRLFALFLISGILTVFFDFLTAETITFTIPLLFILYVKYKTASFHNFRKGFLFSLKSGLLWLAGYCGMWFLKWTLASLVLKQNVFSDAVISMQNRLGSTSIYMELPQPLNALLRNFSMISGFSNGISLGAMLFIVLTILFGTSFLLLFLGKKTKSPFAILCLMIGFLPYLRFLVLNNHSNIHFFFTYRAQLCSIIAWGLALFDSLDYSFLFSFKNLLYKKRSF